MVAHAATSLGVRKVSRLSFRGYATSLEYAPLDGEELHMAPLLFHDPCVSGERIELEPGVGHDSSTQCVKDDCQNLWDGHGGRKERENAE